MTLDEAYEQADSKSHRTCLAVLYFLDEEVAMDASDAVRAAGRTYNGGFFHGMRCGREVDRDYTGADGVRRFAVTC